MGRERIKYAGEIKGEAKMGGTGEMGEEKEEISDKNLLGILISMIILAGIAFLSGMMIGQEITNEKWENKIKIEK